MNGVLWKNEELNALKGLMAQYPFLSDFQIAEVAIENGILNRSTSGIQTKISEVRAAERVAYSQKRKKQQRDVAQDEENDKLDIIIKLLQQNLAMQKALYDIWTK